jgi:hypothetical protein
MTTQGNYQLVEEERFFGDYPEQITTTLINLKQAESSGDESGAEIYSAELQNTHFDFCIRIDRFLRGIDGAIKSANSGDNGDRQALEELRSEFSSQLEDYLTNGAVAEYVPLPERTRKALIRD